MNANIREQKLLKILTRSREAAKEGENLSL
jgi:hypothetical protein